MWAPWGSTSAEAFGSLIFNHHLVVEPFLHFLRRLHCQGLFIHGRSLMPFSLDQLGYCGVSGRTVVGLHNWGRMSPTRPPVQVRERLLSSMMTTAVVATGDLRIFHWDILRSKFQLATAFPVSLRCLRLLEGRSVCVEGMKKLAGSRLLRFICVDLCSLGKKNLGCYFK